MIDEWANRLIGLSLDAVTLGKGATSFEFSGKKNEEYFGYSAGTMFEVCFHEEGIFKSDIRDHESTVLIWQYLELILKDISLSGDQRVCKFTFDDHKSIYVWSREIDHDNLFVVRRFQSDEWWTIG